MLVWDANAKGSVDETLMNYKFNKSKEEYFSLNMYYIALKDEMWARLCESVCECVFVINLQRIVYLCKKKVPFSNLRTGQWLPMCVMHGLELSSWFERMREKERERKETEDERWHSSAHWAHMKTVWHFIFIFE